MKFVKLDEKMLNGKHLVYHATYHGDLILEQDRLLGKTRCVINGISRLGFSVTRDFRFAKAFCPVVFGLNRDKLRNRFLIKPFADSTIGIDADIPGDHRREAEEFVVAQEIKLSDYLEGIWANTEQLLNKEDEEFLLDLEKHPLFMGWFDPI